MTNMSTAAPLLLPNQPNNLQRIYIGGIDVDRLPIHQVTQRVRSSIHHDDDDDIHNNEAIQIDVPRGGEIGGYFFVSVGEEDGRELIQKYNNVKWRGCRLKVEFAKKSFLERLEEEREDRKAVTMVLLKSSNDVNANVNVKEEDENKEQEEALQLQPSTVVPSLPRNLKIRHKYGAERMKVDTKPLEVRVSSRKKIFNQPLYRDISKRRTRAFHVIFDSEEEEGDKSSDEEDESVSTNSSSGKNFVWPDEDKSSCSRNSEEIDGESACSNISIEKPSKEQFILSDDGLSNEKNREQNVDEINIEKNKTGKYVWSDEDSDSASSESYNEYDKVQSKFKLDRVECCEFTSALDDERDQNKDDDSSTMFFLDDDVETADVEYENTQSMKVLTTMFPDLKPRKQKKLEPFGAIIIPRFDPTAEISLEIKQKEDEENNNHTDTYVEQEVITKEEKVVDMVKADPEDDEDSNINTDANKKAEDLEDVYRQKDLEVIFQSAKQTSTPINKIETEATQETTKSANVAPDGGFSFGFSLKQSDKMQSGDIKDSQSSGERSDTNASIESNMLPQSTSIEKKQIDYPRRYRGLFSPMTRSELNGLQQSFFGLNDIENIGDEERAEKWNNKRKFLTTDWKQKRKRALKKVASKNSNGKWKRHRSRK